MYIYSIEDSASALEAICAEVDRLSDSITRCPFNSCEMNSLITATLILQQIQRAKQI